MSDLSRPRWLIALRPLITAALIGLCLLAIFGWLAGCRPPSPPVVAPPSVPTWSLDVQVSEADGGVADARLEIVDGPNKGVISGRTDATGRLLITQLQQSGFTICASRGDDYQIGCAGVTLTSSQNVTLKLFRKWSMLAGQVELCGGHGLCAGGVRHYFGGASGFWFPWGYRNARGALDDAFEDLRPGAHDFVREIAHIVGPDPWWADRHNDLTQPGAIADVGALLDYQAAKAGLRAWLVIFGDVSYTAAVRQRIVTDLIPVLQARRQLLVAIEVVNEGPVLKPTTFDVGEARRYATQLQAALPGTVVLVSSPPSETCADLQAWSVGMAVAPHFSRNTSGTKGLWTPAAQPWMGDTQPRWCGGRATFDGEGIGIGSSVTSDNDPTRLAMARATGGASGLAADVLHSAAGVYGRLRYRDQPGFMESQEAVRQMRALINTKPDLQDWSRGGSSDGPWTVRDLPNDHAGIDGTVDRVYCGFRGADSWCSVLDVRKTTTLVAKMPMHYSVHAGAAALGELRAGDVDAGQSITLEPDTAGVVVIGSAR